MQQSERPAVTKQIMMSLDCEADRFLRAHVSQRQMGRYISQLLMFEKMKMLQAKQKQAKEEEAPQTHQACGSRVEPQACATVSHGCATAMRENNSTE